MIQDPLLLLTLIIINFADVVMVYFVSRSVLKANFQIKKIRFDHETSFFKISKYKWFETKVSKLEVALAISHAIVAGFL